MNVCSMCALHGECVGLSVTPHFLVSIELDAAGGPFRGSTVGVSKNSPPLLLLAPLLLLEEVVVTPGVVGGGGTSPTVVLPLAASTAFTASSAVRKTLFDSVLHTHPGFSESNFIPRSFINSSVTNRPFTLLLAFANLVRPWYL